MSVTFKEIYDLEENDIIVHKYLNMEYKISSVKRFKSNNKKITIESWCGGNYWKLKEDKLFLIGEIKKHDNSKEK